MIKHINILHNRRQGSASAYVSFVEGSTEDFLFGKEIRYAFNRLKDHNNSTSVNKTNNTSNKIESTRAQIFPPMGTIEHWELHVEHDFLDGFPEIYEIPTIPKSLLDDFSLMVAEWTNPKTQKNNSL